MSSEYTLEELREFAARGDDFRPGHTRGDIAAAFAASLAKRAVDAERALSYVFGNGGALNWKRIVDEGLTPPWPLERHAIAMGLFKREPADAGVTDEVIQWMREQAGALHTDNFDCDGPSQNHKLAYAIEDAADSLAARHARQGDAFQDRPTHHVHRGHESIPCHCWSDADHAIGKEVAKPEQSRQGEIAADPIGWVFQHEETGRMSFCENDGVNNPTNFAENNPRHVFCSPAYATPQAQPEQAKAGDWDAVSLILELVENEHGGGLAQSGCKYCVAFDNLTAALPTTTGEACQHEWVDARNDYVKSGELCVKCMAIRSGNATTGEGS